MKILIFISIIIIILIVIFFRTQNNLIFPSIKINYNDTPDISDNIKVKSLYLLNYVISSYNDLCNFDTYSPSVECISVTRLYNKLTILGVTYTNKAGLVYIFEDHIIISFRGTSLKIDELVDADVKYYNYPQTEVSVHRGFHYYYTSISDQINDIIKNNNNKIIYITGHSLGASVASIAAYELGIMDPTLDIRLTLFACPKSGNKNFIDSFGSNVISIVNYFDIVPESPEYINKMFSIKPIYIFGIQDDSDIKNHSLSIYNDGIPIMELLNVI